MFQSMNRQIALDREREIRRQTALAVRRRGGAEPVARRRIRVGRTVQVRVWLPVPRRGSP